MASFTADSAALNWSRASERLAWAPAGALMLALPHMPPSLRDSAAGTCHTTCAADSSPACTLSALSRCGPCSEHTCAGAAAGKEMNNNPEKEILDPIQVQKAPVGY